MTITAQALTDSLIGRGYRHFSGVPCSDLEPVLNGLNASPGIRYVNAVNEGSGVAIAAGFALSGQKSAVLMQDSGLGNAINPLTSLSLAYGLPCLLIISVHAGASGPEGEPQHHVMAAAVRPILEALNIPFYDIGPDDDGLREAVQSADQRVESGGVAALLLRHSSMQPCVSSNPMAHSPGYPLRRIDAVRAVLAATTPQDVVIGAAGMISQELFTLADRPANFYMLGSMGHAPALALGIAMSPRPTGRIIVLDGDGAVLMHMGTLSTIASFAPKTMLHVVLDNEAYGSTGRQPTTSLVSRLDKIAYEAGYRRVCYCEDEAELVAALAEPWTDGPAMLLAKVNCEEHAGTRRVVHTHEPRRHAASFREFLAGPGLPATAEQPAAVARDRGN